jgi:ABC-type polysaccharide/polyol phosphate export permease
MKVKQKLRAAFGLFYFYSMAYLIRAPASAIMVLIRMMIFIALLTLVAGFKYIDHALTGALVALAFGAGLSQLSVDISAMRLSGMRYMLLSTPLGPVSYALSTAFGMSLLSFISLSFFMAIWYARLHPAAYTLLIALAVLSLVWIAGVLLGYVLSTSIQTPQTLFNITDTLYALLVYLMPVYYPIKVLPESLRPFTYISPATHASIILRELAFNGRLESIENMIALLMFVVVFGMIVAKKAKWVES